MLIFTTLGAASLTEFADAPIVRLGAGKPLALLTYLALAPKRTATREELLMLLWSDVTTDRGLRSLRQAVWQIRHTLGADALQGIGRELKLTIPARVDRDDFLDAVARGDSMAALQAYHGPFLPNFALPGADEFERWADAERLRLLRAFTMCGASAVRDLLDKGRISQAQAIARRVRDSEPSRESHWRLVLEALIAGNDAVGVQMECEALKAMLAMDGITPEPATRDLLRTVAGTPSDAPPAHKAGHEHAGAEHEAELRSELVGREREFATLLAAWKTARTGRIQHVHVVASAGLGKTRLLHDTAARLRAQGIRVFMLRAHPSERAIPYSLAADVAATIGNAPGAAGISAQALETLVALAPQLAPRAPAARTNTSATEPLRRRVAAITELLEAVTDERPIALLVDDVHWADPVSVQLLHAVLERARESHALVVTAARPALGASATIASHSTNVIALAPFSCSDVQSFVAGLGSLPEERWVESFLVGLHAATGGSPLLLLETLRLVLERGALQCIDGQWTCSDGAALASFLQDGDAIRRRLRALPPDEGRMLLVLAAAGRSIDEALLLGVARRQSIGDARRLLLSLEQRGLALTLGNEWQIAHDEIGRASLSVAGEGDVAAAHGDVAYTILDAEVDAAALQRTAHHFLEAGDASGLAITYRRWIRDSLARGQRSSARALAVALCGTDVNQSRIDALVSALSTVHRIRLHSTGVRAIAVACMIAAVSSCAMLIRYQRQPTRIVLEDGPMTMASWIPLAPAPVVEFRDRRGRRVTSVTDTVRVSIRGVAGRLVGTLTARAVNGRAVFPDLVYDGPSAHMPALVFTAAGLPPITTSPMGVDHADSVSTLEFVRAELDGQVLSPERRVVHVNPGDDIGGDITFRYTSAWPAASVVLGAVPAWGDKRTTWRAIGPMVTPVRGAIRTARITLHGPSEPGTYHLFFAFQAEDGVQFVASGTNWEVRRPIWGDGNDVADWTAAQIREANATGRVRSIRLQKDGTRVPYYVQATALTVVVDGRERANRPVRGY